MPEARVIPIGDGEQAKARRVRPAAKRGATTSTPAKRPAQASSAKVRPAAATKTTKAEKAEQAEQAAARATEQAATAARETAEQADVDAAVTEVLGGEPEPGDWDRRVAGALAFLRRRVTGDFEVDDFGFDPELNDKVLMALLRPLYEKWFRIETRGLENIPDAGGGLIVANHSGTVALDAMMTQLAILDHHPAHRPLRMLGANLVFQSPVIGEFARKSGATLACNADAERLLTRGELAGVWPEGFKGIGKPFSERYKLQRFGRGGFVSAALRTKVPIIPTSIVGAEEIYPILGNARLLARLLNLPYFPLTPTFPWLGPLGLVPFPSKWIIEFGEPIPTDVYAEGAADDPMLVFNLTDQVRETIQHTLYKLLMQRRSVFF